MEIMALRYFGFRDLTEVARITLDDFEKYLKASQLRRLDKEYFISLQAFKNQEVQATTGSGKNVKSKFNTFKDFFDYEGREQEILGIKQVEKIEEDTTLRKLLLEANS